MFNFDVVYSFSLACRCAEEAKKGGYYFFAIRYWAECYGGMDKSELEVVIADKTKRSTLCKNDQFKECNDSHSDECVGNQNSEYVYSFKQEGIVIIFVLELSQ